MISHFTSTDWDSIRNFQLSMKVPIPNAAPFRKTLLGYSVYMYLECMLVRYTPTLEICSKLCQTSSYLWIWNRLTSEELFNRSKSRHIIAMHIMLLVAVWIELYMCDAMCWSCFFCACPNFAAMWHHMLESLCATDGRPLGSITPHNSCIPYTDYAYNIISYSRSSNVQCIFHWCNHIHWVLAQSLYMYMYITI